MNARICDRCGKQINYVLPEVSQLRKGNVVVGTYIHGYGEDISGYDLCEECTRKLFDFIHEYKNTRSIIRHA